MVGVSCGLLLATNQHRHVAVRQYLLSLAPEQNRLHPLPAMRCHDDEIALALFATLMIASYG